jgi:hypothetical protein
MEKECFTDGLKIPDLLDASLPFCLGPYVESPLFVMRADTA